MNNKRTPFKKLTYLDGIFQTISEPESFEKTTGGISQKARVTITTEDGQKGFFEVRERIIKAIEMLRITEGTNVRIGFVLIGSEKPGKTFNNLFINEIEII